jgi:hypothetical protein
MDFVGSGLAMWPWPTGLIGLLHCGGGWLVWAGLCVVVVKRWLGKTGRKGEKRENKISWALVVFHPGIQNFFFPNGRKKT